ncbi:uncharacterized protein LOC110027693 [Phalaenopsis equestris]|uniref:uncharacterized protein LOC110027693 n=1 Tax=Phalaenopsis equestris TaxID=78828 RepID=UPI0009E48FB1|nr:uncharacterized protein LOC110027693 [Phalaenopsis equestris]
MAGPAAAADAAGVQSPSPSSLTAILRQSMVSFFSSLPALLLVSLLLLSLRSALLAGTLRLSSLPDTDPLLRSLLSRLSTPSSSSSSSPTSSSPKTPRFFHLSPAVPLADDFFSSSPSIGRRSFSNSSFASPIYVYLSLNSTAVARVGVRPKYPLDPPSRILFSISDSENSSQEDADRAAKGFSLGKDGVQLVHLVSLLSSAHAIAIIGFILYYATAFGVVFYSVTCNMLSRPIPSFIHALWCGARLGVRRLVGFVFLKWAIRDALVQLLCIFFFVNIEDQNKLFKLFVKVKLMPFSLTLLSGNEVAELSGFLFVWGLLDLVVSMFLVLVPWIVVVDDIRRTGQEVVKEGVFLVTLVRKEFLWINCLEMVLSGGLGRLFFSTFAGRRFARWIQAVFEVYFMVVWLVVYLEARRKDWESRGRRFGREELERCIDRL